MYEYLDVGMVNSTTVQGWICFLLPPSYLCFILSVCLVCHFYLINLFILWQVAVWQLILKSHLIWFDWLIDNDGGLLATGAAASAPRLLLSAVRSARRESQGETWTTSTGSVPLQRHAHGACEFLSLAVLVYLTRTAGQIDLSDVSFLEYCDHDGWVTRQLPTINNPCCVSSKVFSRKRSFPRWLSC